MNPAELAALEDELKKDLEAIARVRKVLSSKNGSALNANAPPIRVPDVAGDQDDDLLDDSPITSLRGAVEKTVNSDPATKWTTQKVLARMQHDGYNFKAKKPIYSVGQALQKLVQAGRIRLARQGVGAAPNIYRAKLTSEQGEQDKPINETGYQ